MKVSYRWLSDMLDNTSVPSPEKLEELLTFGAFEVEGIEHSEGGDSILDVKILANRAADCMSHRGIAAEVAALLRQPLAKDPFSEKLIHPKQSEILDIFIENSERCARYIGAVVEGVTVGPSPKWLKEQLEALGQRSINNIVDITNYVMLETGQPLHAFDADKLAQKNGGWKICVRNAHQGETITTLTGEVYPLGQEDLVIADMYGDQAIGIAGVKGGKHAEITTDTKNIIIESANFSWLSVRKTAKRHNLSTDASKRFEHAPSLHLAEHGMARALALVAKHSGGLVVSVRDTNPHPPQNKSVEISLHDVEKILGMSVTEDEIKSIFSLLRFRTTQNGETWSVIAPGERTDITIPQDVIEEIGRLVGLDRIQEVELPQVTEKPSINQQFAKESIVKKVLVAENFSEVSTTVFVPKKDGEIELENPLAEDRPRLRARIATPGFEAALSLNTRNAPLLGTEEIKIFEVGTVYTQEGEIRTLAIGVHAKKQKRISELLDKAVSAVEQEIGTALVGYGIVNGTIREFNLSKTFESVAQLNAYKHIPYDTEHARFTPISPYPYVLRDIAVWAPLGIEAPMVAARIDQNGGPLLVRRQLFDEFKKENQVSFAFHLVFQSKEKTLNATEVNEYMQKIEDAIKKSGWTVR